jgi:hypothetical protein
VLPRLLRIVSGLAENANSIFCDRYCGPSQQMDVRFCESRNHQPRGTSARRNLTSRTVRSRERAQDILLTLDKRLTWRAAIRTFGLRVRVSSCLPFHFQLFRFIFEGPQNRAFNLRSNPAIDQCARDDPGLAILITSRNRPLPRHVASERGEMLGRRDADKKALLSIALPGLRRKSRARKRSPFAIRSLTPLPM